MTVQTSAAACNIIDAAAAKIVSTFGPLSPADLDELAGILGLVPTAALAAA